MGHLYLCVLALQVTLLHISVQQACSRSHPLGSGRQAWDAVCLSCHMLLLLLLLLLLA
jgi:hypothetical protein